MKSVCRAGTANFSIRGLGINSSIPTIDPTVGVFVDGVYMGTNAMVLYDAFDLEGIEVLRGPQGVLFGRNVVGGAVLLNTKAPTDQYEARVRSAVEGGGKAPNIYVSGTLNAPLTDTLAYPLHDVFQSGSGLVRERVRRPGVRRAGHPHAAAGPLLATSGHAESDAPLRVSGPRRRWCAAVQNTVRFDRRSHDFFGQQRWLPGHEDARFEYETGLGRIVGQRYGHQHLWLAGRAGRCPEFRG